MEVWCQRFQGIRIEGGADARSHCPAAAAQSGVPRGAQRRVRDSKRFPPPTVVPAISLLSHLPVPGMGMPT